MFMCVYTFRYSGTHFSKVWGWRGPRVASRPPPRRAIDVFSIPTPRSGMASSTSWRRARHAGGAVFRRNSSLETLFRAVCFCFVSVCVSSCFVCSLSLSLSRAFNKARDTTQLVYIFAVWAQHSCSPLWRARRALGAHIPLAHSAQSGDALGQRTLRTLSGSCASGAQ